MMRNCVAIMCAASLAGCLSTDLEVPGVGSKPYKLTAYQRDAIELAMVHVHRSNSRPFRLLALTAKKKDLADGSSTVIFCGRADTGITSPTGLKIEQNFRGTFTPPESLDPVVHIPKTNAELSRLMWYCTEEDIPV